MFAFIVKIWKTTKFNKNQSLPFLSENHQFGSHRHSILYWELLAYENTISPLLCVAFQMNLLPPIIPNINTPPAHPHLPFLTYSPDSCPKCYSPFPYGYLIPWKTNTPHPNYLDVLSYSAHARQPSFLYLSPPLFYFCCSHDARYCYSPTPVAP